jgi:hypothetical protein
MGKNRLMKITQALAEDLPGAMRGVIVRRVVKPVAAAGAALDFAPIDLDLRIIHLRA